MYMLKTSLSVSLLQFLFNLIATPCGSDKSHVFIFVFARKYEHGNYRDVCAIETSAYTIADIQFEQNCINLRNEIFVEQREKLGENTIQTVHGSPNLQLPPPSYQDLY